MTVTSLYEPAPEPFVKIVDTGQSLTRIVVPVQATYLEGFAADELSRYLEKISGVKISVQKETDPTECPYTFFLGGTQRAVEADIPTEEEALGRDGSRYAPSRTGS